MMHAPRLSLAIGTTLACAAIFAAIGAAPHQPAAAAPPQATATPRVLCALMGSDTRNPAAGFSRITTTDAWKTFWAAHQGDRLERNSRGWAITPEIDFSTCMVLACIRGPAHNNDGEAIEAIDIIDGALRIRFDSLTYQTASLLVPNAPPPPPLPTLHPYGIWIIPRTEMPIIIEENIQHLLNNPPIWKQVSQFDQLPAGQ